MGKKRVVKKLVKKPCPKKGGVVAMRAAKRQKPNRKGIAEGSEGEAIFLNELNDDKLAVELGLNTDTDEVVARFTEDRIIGDSAFGED